MPETGRWVFVLTVPYGFFPDPNRQRRVFRTMFPLDHPEITRRRSFFRRRRWGTFLVNRRQSRYFSEGIASFSQRATEVLKTICLRQSALWHLLQNVCHECTHRRLTATPSNFRNKVLSSTGYRVEKAEFGKKHSSALTRNRGVVITFPASTFFQRKNFLGVLSILFEGDLLLPSSDFSGGSFLGPLL